MGKRPEHQRGMTFRFAFTGLHLALPARSIQKNDPCCRIVAVAERPPCRHEPILLSRRATLSLGALLALTALPGTGARAEDEAPAKLLTLPSLPYAYDALEPAIDKETMILHHDKHFAKFVRF
jgi:Iron/manganese superoxide dismutases, alpha-hairpin domain